MTTLNERRTDLIELNARIRATNDIVELIRFLDWPIAKNDLVAIVEENRDHDQARLAELKKRQQQFGGEESQIEQGEGRFDQHCMATTPPRDIEDSAYFDPDFHGHS